MLKKKIRKSADAQERQTMEIAANCAKIGSGLWRAEGVKGSYTALEAAHVLRELVQAECVEVVKHDSFGNVYRVLDACELGKIVSGETVTPRLVVGTLAKFEKGDVQLGLLEVLGYGKARKLQGDGILGQVRYRSR